MFEKNKGEGDPPIFIQTDQKRDAVNLSITHIKKRIRGLWCTLKGATENLKIRGIVMTKEQKKERGGRKEGRVIILRHLKEVSGDTS